MGDYLKGYKYKCDAYDYKYTCNEGCTPQFYQIPKYSEKELKELREVLKN